MTADTVARLCGVATVAVCLAVAGVQSAVGVEVVAALGDSVRLATGTDALALAISPKRALVSLAFLGAIAARRVRDPTA